MAKQNINIGVSPNDGTGDPVRTAFSKAKGNFDELYARATGDMNKSTYDADNSGAVDAADKVTGVDAAGNVTYYGKDAAGNIGFHEFALDKVDAYADFASFPIAGFDDVIYIDKAAFVLYLWDDVNTIYKAVAGGVSQGYVDAKVEDVITDGVLDKAPSQNAVFDALALKANSSQVLTDVPAGALFTDTVYNDTAIQADVDSKVKKRTIKTITTTVSYTLIAADFTDFILEFTANASEEISIVLNAGVAPLNGELQMISTGNNKLVPSLGVGVTATYPEQTNPKTILKGWLGGIVTATDTISFNGSLESTATSGIADAPSDGSPYSRQDAAWVLATGTTYNPFTNTVDGLVPAPNVGGTTYTVDITSPTEGATVTEGQVVSVTIDLPAGVASSSDPKLLSSNGWILENTKADVRLSNLAADLNTTEKDAIKSKLGVNSGGIVLDSFILSMNATWQSTSGNADWNYYNGEKANLSKSNKVEFVDVLTDTATGGVNLMTQIFTAPYNCKVLSARIIYYTATGRTFNFAIGKYRYADGSNYNDPLTDVALLHEESFTVSSLTRAHKIITPTDANLLTGEGLMFGIKEPSATNTATIPVSFQFHIQKT